MQRFIACALACLAFGFLTATPALARDVNARRVSYADLDLSNDAGARVLLRRIDQAARAVCGDRSGPMPITKRNQIRMCIAETTGQTVAAVNAPVVTALYEGAPQIVVAAR